MIYFDNSATTAIEPSALDAYVQTSQGFFGNPSSLHDLGTKANSLLIQARQQIADLIHVDPAEIFFTSGGTEGDNWAVKGTAYEKRPFGKHLITTQIEHPAVLNTMAELEKQGFEVTYLPVDKHGFVDPADVQKSIRKDTILVSVMAVNNEIGSIQPIKAISKILANHPSIHFHVDGVQGIGKDLWQQIYDPRVDLMTFSGHKFHGPRGIGFMYLKKGRKLTPLMAGGGQENNQRSGTENLPAIVAMAKALRLTLTDEDVHAKAQAKLRATLAEHLKATPKIQLFSGLDSNFAPHILTFAIPGVRGETIVHAFEAEDIYISTTSACSSKKQQMSGTLKAMHVPEAIATSAVRVSLDANNTADEMARFMQVFNQINASFSQLSD